MRRTRSYFERIQSNGHTFLKREAKNSSSQPRPYKACSSRLGFGEDSLPFYSQLYEALS